VTLNCKGFATSTKNGSHCVSCYNIFKNLKKWKTPEGKIQKIVDKHRASTHCPICLNKFDLINTNCRKAKALDHCHEELIPRGTICKGCNIGLGGFSDNIDNLARATKYLKNKGNLL